MFLNYIIIIIIKKPKLTKQVAWCGNQQIKTVVTKKHSSKNRVRRSHQ